MVPFICMGVSKKKGLKFNPGKDLNYENLTGFLTEMFSYRVLNFLDKKTSKNLLGKFK